MGFEGKPENVKEAFDKDDREALSRMGKKGGEKSGKITSEYFAMKRDEKKRQTILHEYNRILHESGQEAADKFIKELE